MDRDTEARSNRSELRIVGALDLVAAELVLSCALTRRTAIGYVSTLNKKKNTSRKKYPQFEGTARAPATRATTTRVLENILKVVND